MRRTAWVLILGSVTIASAEAPKPVVALAQAIDGASRTTDDKTCKFSVTASCKLPIKIACKSSVLSYSYTTTIPLAKVDLTKSRLLEKNAGDFPGSFGLELVTTEDFETVMDDGTKTAGRAVVLAFGATPAEHARAKKAFAGIPAAKKACK